MARPKKFDEHAVLTKAVDLFWHRGYEATSMEDLVQGLGINRASLYATFGDKHALFLRALGQYRQESGSAVCQHLQQGRPAPQVVGELLTMAVAESAGDGQQRGCFMVNSAVELAPHDAQVAQIVVENQQRIEEQLTVVLAAGQAAGTITHAHAPAALAAFVFSTLNGIKVLGKTRPVPAVLEQVAAVAMTILAPAGVTGR